MAHKKEPKTIEINFPKFKMPVFKLPDYFSKVIEQRRQTKRLVRLQKKMQNVGRTQRRSFLDAMVSSMSFRKTNEPDFVLDVEDGKTIEAKSLTSMLQTEMEIVRNSIRSKRDKCLDMASNTRKSRKPDYLMETDDPYVLRKTRAMSSLSKAELNIVRNSIRRERMRNPYARRVR